MVFLLRGAIINILICVSEYPPNASGIGNVAHFVKEEFTKKGHQCKVCSPTGPDITIFNNNYINKMGGLGIIYFWYKVSNYFLKHNVDYDIVWMHQPLFLLKKCPFKNAIITVHTTYVGKVNHKLNYNPIKKLYYYFMSSLERVSYLNLPSSFKYTCIDPQVANELRRIGVNGYCELISNGVNISTFNLKKDKQILRKKYSIDTNQKVFISVGRLIDVKRPFLMLELFKCIQKEYINTTLIMVGSGYLLERVENYITQHNIMNVLLMGHLTHNDLAELYSLSNYYLITSSYEGQPLTLLEAMASGLPCIVSDIPNLRLVEEQKCGIAIDLSDIKEATANVLMYINKNNAEHSINARKYVENQLDWNIIANKYLELFSK